MEIRGQIVVLHKEKLSRDSLDANNEDLTKKFDKKLADLASHLP